jgi:DNA-binding GntR family transcriptional regulator|tara:strand:- start:5734 stop:6450 length:717 start_codon:yes stop_codon:yes gene_type:complete
MSVIKSSDLPGVPLSEQAYLVLRKAILANVLAPGYFASEREVSERFGLSRTPVREALLKLRDEGLIEVQPRRGVRVLPLSVKDMREIHQVARALELEAALLLCEREGDEPLKALAQSAQDMRDAIKVKDRDKWVEADAKFHIGIVASSKNDRLIQQYNSLRVLTDRARLFVLYIRELPVQSTKEHIDMLVAIEARNKTEIASLYRSHWERTTNEIISIIEEFNRRRSGDVPDSQIMVP